MIIKLAARKHRFVRVCQIGATCVWNRFDLGSCTYWLLIVDLGVDLGLKDENEI